MKQVNEYQNETGKEVDTTVVSKTEQLARCEFSRKERERRCPTSEVAILHTRPQSSHSQRSRPSTFPFWCSSFPLFAQRRQRYLERQAQLFVLMSLDPKMEKQLDSPSPVRTANDFQLGCSCFNSSSMASFSTSHRSIERNGRYLTHRAIGNSRTQIMFANVLKRKLP